MRAVIEHLVRPADGLVLLATPPFDTSVRDPGYLKGYPPGVRENGGADPACRHVGRLGLR